MRVWAIFYQKIMTENHLILKNQKPQNNQNQQNGYNALRGVECSEFISTDGALFFFVINFHRTRRTFLLFHFISLFQNWE